MSGRFIPVAHPAFLGNEKKYVNECLESSWISSAGKFIGSFEQGFASFCGTQYAIACNSGTSALHLALLALDIGPGDEVIVPALTFVSTANAVRYCGAEPVFVDSEPRTMNIDPSAIEQAINPRTKAIIVVHLFGMPADMDRISEIARRHGLFIIEDAAEAHGAMYKGRMVGSFGQIAAYSFFGNKIMTTGEGGMVTTNDSALNEKVRLLRGQGMDPGRRYWFPIIGYNYRMTNIQAALGLAQLENIAMHLEARRRVAGWYQRALESHADLFELPLSVEGGAEHVYWMYSIVLKQACKVERDEVMRRMMARGVETRPVFYPLHQLPPYRHCNRSLPVAEALARNGISLPTHAMLTEDDVNFVSRELVSVCKGQIELE